MSHGLRVGNLRKLLRHVPSETREPGIQCLFLGTISARAILLEALCDIDERGILVMASESVELFRTGRASQLLEKWFPADSPGGNLPEQLQHQVRTFLDASTAQPPTAHRLTAEESGEALLVELFGFPESLPVFSHACMVSLREVHQAPEAPEAWRARLTPRQLEVSVLILRGWSNELIASHLGCSTATVKKQVSSIFDRLGICSRAQLFMLATSGLPRSNPAARP